MFLLVVQQQLRFLSTITARTRSFTTSSITISMRPSILLFGDSITQEAFGVDGNIGWASLLAADYTRRADVLNRGYSGYNTNHAVELLPRVLVPLQKMHKFLFCTVFFGANDAALAGEPQHVPLERYTENVKTIVRSIRASHDCPVVLIAPPPIEETMWGDFLKLRGQGGSDRSNEHTRSYGLALEQVAKENDCLFLDAWTLMEGDKSTRGSFVFDGLHLNEKGNRALYNGLMDLLEANRPEVLPMMDGDGRYGTKGVPLEEKLWRELC